MAEHRLDDLINTLAQALFRTRHRCAHRHLQRLQVRLGGQTLDVSRLVDGEWWREAVPLAELVTPLGILATTLEVQIDCELEELDAEEGQPASIALYPCSERAEHCLTIRLRGGSPLNGEVLLDGQVLRHFSVDPRSVGGY
jgi:hypothetical protein